MLRTLRIAARNLRSWGFGAAVAVTTLAIGIGSATTLYTFLGVALSGSAPAIDGIARVGRIFASNPALGVERSMLTLSEFDQALTGTRSFEAAAYMSVEARGGPASDSEEWSVMRVSPAFFPVLRAHALEGRLFTALDFEDSGAVALISEGMWRLKFAGQAIAGDTRVWIDGAERRVVGVVPAKFEFPFIGVGGDAWIPLAGAARDGQVRVGVIARLKPESTWKTAAAEIGALAPPAQRDSSWRWLAIPVEQDLRQRFSNVAAFTFVPALIVLIIACVNVSCMLLARGVRRDSEFSIRAALGASRGAILRQLLTESMLLAAVAALAGAALALGGLRYLRMVLLPVTPSFAARLSADPGLLGVAFASAALACLVFGALPAIRFSRPDIASWLKGVQSPSQVRVAGYGALDLIVFFELGLAVVLVTVAAMWLSFFTMLQRNAPSFPADEVVVARIHSRDAAPITDRVRAIPGVFGVALASERPGRLRPQVAMLRSKSGRLARGALVEVGDSFFGTIGLSIVRGRAFDRTEAGRDAAVVVVSQSVAMALWPDEEALGQDLLGDSRTSKPLQVIGISRNAVEYGGLGILNAGEVYRPLDLAEPREVTLLVRAGKARLLTRQIAMAARASPLSPMTAPATSADAMAKEFALPEFFSLIRIVAGFGLVALLLAASGIFGVISESLAQRRTEFGVRMALGATTGRILGMVLAREGKLIGAAIGAGAIGTVAVTRVLFAELVVIAARNPWWPAALMLGCGLVAGFASVLAAYRTVRLDPCEVLRRA